MLSRLLQEPTNHSITETMLGQNLFFIAPAPPQGHVERPGAKLLAVRSAQVQWHGNHEPDTSTT